VIIGRDIVYRDVSENNGTPKSSILIGFSSFPLYVFHYKPSILGYPYHIGFGMLWVYPHPSDKKNKKHGPHPTRWDGLPVNQREFWGPSR